MQFEQAAFRWGIPDLGEWQLEITAEDMKIVMRKKEKVSGLDLDDFAPAGKTGET